MYYVLHFYVNYNKSLRNNLDEPGEEISYNQRVAIGNCAIFLHGDVSLQDTKVSVEDIVLDDIEDCKKNVYTLVDVRILSLLV